MSIRALSSTARRTGREVVKNQATVNGDREDALILNGFWLGACDSHPIFHNFLSPFRQCPARNKNVAAPIPLRPPSASICVHPRFPFFIKKKWRNKANGSFACNAARQKQTQSNPIFWLSCWRALTTAVGVLTEGLRTDIASLKLAKKETVPRPQGRGRVDTMRPTAQSRPHAALDRNRQTSRRQ